MWLLARFPLKPVLAAAGAGPNGRDGRPVMSGGCRAFFRDEAPAAIGAIDHAAVAEFHRRVAEGPAAAVAAHACISTSIVSAGSMLAPPLSQWPNRSGPISVAPSQERRARMTAPTVGYRMRADNQRNASWRAPFADFSDRPLGQRLRVAPPAGPPTVAPALSATHVTMADGAALPLRRWLPRGRPRGRPRLARLQRLFPRLPGPGRASGEGGDRGLRLRSAGLGAAPIAASGRAWRA